MTATSNAPRSAASAVGRGSDPRPRLVRPRCRRHRSRATGRPAAGPPCLRRCRSPWRCRRSRRRAIASGRPTQPWPMTSTRREQSRLHDRRGHRVTLFGDGRHRHRSDVAYGCMVSRIVAIGGGEIGRPGYPVDTTELDAEVVRLTGRRRPRLVFLPTATCDDAGYVATMKEHYGRRLGWHVEPAERCSTEHATPLRVERTIATADIVYVGGGNTLRMMKLWRRRGVDRLLMQAAARGHGASWDQCRRYLLVHGRRERLSLVRRSRRLLAIHRRSWARPRRRPAVSPPRRGPAVTDELPTTGRNEAPCRMGSTTAPRSR